MALINCPECKREISDKSSQCINCGAPSDLFKIQVLEEKKTKSEFSESSNKQEDKFLKLVFSVIMYAFFTSIQWFLIVAYSFTYIRQGPSGFIAFFGTLALIISFLIVKKINSLSSSTTIKKNNLQIQKKESQNINYKHFQKF